MFTKFSLALSILIIYCDVISCGRKRDFIELAAEIGLTAVKEEVLTKDGYILNVIHIPGEKGPVFLQHGILDTADAFVLRKRKSLTAVLADAGYEIFLGNVRGNRYSTGHTFLNSDKDKDYWNFTMNEHAMYDLPAMIDHALNKTGKDDLIAIGHSEGTAVFFALCSSEPKYNDKIKVLIALAPICYLHNIPPPLSAAIRVSPSINKIFKSLGKEKLFQDKSTIDYLFTTVCSHSYAICVKLILSPIMGHDENEIDKDFIENEMAKHYPTATSRRNINHLAQISLSKKFQRYDYGLVENIKRYGTVTPPEYDLSKVTMQVELLVGRNDKLATVEDVKILSGKLKNCNYKEIEYEKMDHVDFIWGRNMDKYLFNVIFDILDEL